MADRFLQQKKNRIGPRPGHRVYVQPYFWVSHLNYNSQICTLKIIMLLSATFRNYRATGYILPFVLSRLVMSEVTFGNYIRLNKEIGKENKLRGIWHVWAKKELRCNF